MKKLFNHFSMFCFSAHSFVTGIAMMIGLIIAIAGTGVAQTNKCDNLTRYVRKQFSSGNIMLLGTANATSTMPMQVTRLALIFNDLKMLLLPAEAFGGTTSSIENENENDANSTDLIIRRLTLDDATEPQPLKQIWPTLGNRPDFDEFISHRSSIFTVTVQSELRRFALIIVNQTADKSPYSSYLRYSIADDHVDREQFHIKPVEFPFGIGMLLSSIEVRYSIEKPIFPQVVQVINPDQSGTGGLLIGSVQLGTEPNFDPVQETRALCDVPPARNSTIRKMILSATKKCDQGSNLEPIRWQVRVGISDRIAITLFTDQAAYTFARRILTATHGTEFAYDALAYEQFVKCSNESGNATTVTGNPAAKTTGHGGASDNSGPFSSSISSSTNKICQIDIEDPPDGATTIVNFVKTRLQINQFLGPVSQGKRWADYLIYQNQNKLYILIGSVTLLVVLLILLIVVICCCCGGGSGDEDQAGRKQPRKHPDSDRTKVTVGKGKRDDGDKIMTIENNKKSTVMLGLAAPSNVPDNVAGIPSTRSATNTVSAKRQGKNNNKRQSGKSQMMTPKSKVTAIKSISANKAKKILPTASSNKPTSSSGTLVLTDVNSKNRISSNSKSGSRISAIQSSTISKIGGASTAGGGGSSAIMSTSKVSAISRISNKGSAANGSVISVASKKMKKK